MIIQYIIFLLLYYNETKNPKPNGEPNNHNLFENIDYSKEESTNHILEHFYNEILQFKLTTEDNRTIYEYDMDHYHANNKYILLINGNPDKSCSILLPLLSYISTIEWAKIDWKIEII